MFFETTMRVDALSKMKNLKLLMFPEYKQWKVTTNEKKKFSGNLNYVSNNKLGYLIWPYYPFNFLPQCFQPHNLIELDLSMSNIQHLWDNTQLV